jgi:hypothetical protein
MSNQINKLSLKGHDNMDRNLVTVLVAFILLSASINEMRKSILILVKNETQLLFVAQIGLYILRLLGISPKKHKEIMDDYKKNMRLYSIFTIIGAAYFILVAISEIAPLLLFSK